MSGARATPAAAADKPVPDIDALSSAIGDLETPLHDARRMAKIVSLLVEDRVPVPNRDGVTDIGEFGDVLTWAVYHAEDLLKVVFERWNEVNKFGYDMSRRGAR